MKKTASFTELVGDLEAILGDDKSQVKKAEEQGPSEKNVSADLGNDPEVNDMIPGNPNATGGGGDITTEIGKPTGEKLPGISTSLPEQEEQKKEVSPDSKVASANDAFIDGINEIRGLLGSKTAADPAKVEDAKSDPKTKDMVPPGSNEPKNPESTAGNPPVQAGGCGNKCAEDQEEFNAIAQKVATFMSDRNYAYQVATNVIGGLFGLYPQGVEIPGQKTASGEPILTQQQVANLAHLEQQVNNKVAELSARGLNREQIIAEIQKIAFEEGEAMMEPSPEEVAGAAGGGEGGESPGGDAGAGFVPPGAEGGDAGGGASPSEDQQVIVQALTDLVEQGQITPEEALQAAQIIDAKMQEGEALGGEGGMGGEGAPAIPGEGGEGGEGAPPPEAGGGEGGEGGKSEGGGEKKEKSESSEEEKKEAALRSLPNDPYARRGFVIGQLIHQKVAELKGAKKQAAAQPAKTEQPKQASVSLQNQKIAVLKKLNATDAQIGDYMGKLASVAGNDPRFDRVTSNEPTVEEMFFAVDNMVKSGHVQQAVAATALEELANQGQNQKVAAIIRLHNAVVTIKNLQKAAEGDPAAGGPPPGGPPPGGDPSGGGAPGGADPQAAIEQLISSLEQLVSLGMIPEDQAVQVVQSLGLLPPGGGAPGAGGPPPGGAPMGPPPGAGGPPPGAGGPPPGM